MTRKRIEDEQAAGQQAPEVAGVDMGVPGSEKTVLTVVLGLEKYAPIQYHSFDVGPFTAQTELRPGETVGQAYQRLMDELREMQKKEFEARLAEFLGRVRTAASAARGGR